MAVLERARRLGVEVKVLDPRVCTIRDGDLSVAWIVSAAVVGGELSVLVAAALAAKRLVEELPRRAVEDIDMVAAA